MFSATLRRAQFHLRCNHHHRRRCAGMRQQLTSPYTTMAVGGQFVDPLFATTSRLVVNNYSQHHRVNNTLESPRTSGVAEKTVFSDVPNRTLKTSAIRRKTRATRRTSLPAVNGSVHSSPTPQQGKCSNVFASFTKDRPFMLHAPKSMVNTVFNERGCSYYLQHIEYDGDTWYTAIFTDPLTNEVFQSGLGKEINAERRAGSCIYPPLHLAEAKILDGKVYYSDPKYAEHAAAARAIDCYIFREEGAVNNGLRLCMEDPYGTMAEGASQKVDYGALIAQRNLLYAGENNKSSSIPLRKKPFFSSSLVKDKPFLLHTPKYLLGARAFSYDTQRAEYDGRSWYTAKFTDPLANEEFSSGLGKKIKAERRAGSCMYPPLHLAEAKILDGKVYYSEPKLAEHAAAARAIDCYRFRDEGAVDNNLRLCMEDPYETMADGASQKVDYGALLAQRNLLYAGENNKSSSIPLKKKPSFSSSFVKDRPFLLHSPKQLLDAGTFYYDTQRVEYDGRSWNTAKFTDPLTNEEFSSGLVKEINAERRAGTSMYYPLHLAEAKILDGKVYYSDPRNAEHAAAARAIDCYMFRQDGAVDGGLQLCLEDPYASAIERDIQQTDYDALMSRRNDICKVEPDTEEDIQALSFAFAEEPTKVDNKLSTIARITEIWTDTSGLGSSSGAWPQWPDKNSTGENENTLSPTAKIENILHWYEGVNNKPHNHGEACAVAQLCNKILAALGSANRDLNLDEKGSHINVEQDANVILGRIISMSNTFSDPSSLDADTFNSYLHCLNRLDPTCSAKSAESLLKSMRDQEKFRGIILPLPNVGTYNAVMASWALVNGTDAQNGVNDIYNLLEAASLGDSVLLLRPNNETFKTLLAVNSKHDERFSFKQAQIWLSKIKQTSDSICGKALIPDASIYNAALSLLPTQSNTNPTDNRYAKSWLGYGSHYYGGFKSVGKDSNAEAMDIAKWLLYAEECGVKPNTEMYEKVIRAFTQTGTKDGLLIAEDWAKRAVSSSSPTRLETFQPIIAAWALCQFERAPARVREWTNQLEALSATKPGLKPDLHTLGGEIIAWKNVQAGRIARVEEEETSESRRNGENLINSSKDVELAFAAAQNCMQYLRDNFTELPQLGGPQDTAAMISMFRHTIESWGCASRFALVHPTKSVSLDTSHGVHEMLKIARLFDAKIDEDEPDEEHAQSTLRLMGESYAEIMSQLHQIDSAVDSDAETTCYFSKEIPSVERMLRDYDFMSRNVPSDFSPESKALRHRLYKEFLRGCAGVKSPADYGHVARLCKLIQEQLSWQDEQCQDIGVQEDITDIFADQAHLMGTVIEIPEERMYVLTVLWNNARPFFGRRRKLEGSKYATVDRARIIGAMRMAMGDSELTEDFLNNFDRKPPRRKARGNTAMSFVQDMMKKNR